MKKFLLAVAVAAVATMGIASSASAGVERYQTQTMTITAVQPEGAVTSGQHLDAHLQRHAEPVRRLVQGRHGRRRPTAPTANETITGKPSTEHVSFTATRSTDGSSTRW